MSPVAPNELVPHLVGWETRDLRSCSDVCGLDEVVSVGTATRMPCLIRKGVGGRAAFFGRGVAEGSVSLVFRVVVGVALFTFNQAVSWLPVLPTGDCLAVVEMAALFASETAIPHSPPLSHRVVHSPHS